MAIRLRYLAVLVVLGCNGRSQAALDDGHPRSDLDASEPSSPANDAWVTSPAGDSSDGSGPIDSQDSLGAADAGPADSQDSPGVADAGPSDSNDGSPGPADVGPPDSQSQAEGGLATLAWPFSYSFTPNGVAIHTDGGDLFASIGPFGTHFRFYQPIGNAKSDTSGFFTRTLAELSDVDGGPCDAGGSCVISEQEVASRTPTYIAPIAGIVTEVDQDPTATTPRYYPTNLQYSIRMHGGGYDFLFGHLGTISPGLRDKVLAATCAQGTCVDVATWQPFGTGAARNLTIPVAAGEALATPQVAALPLGPPGYLGGAGQADWPPWFEIQFYLSVMGETICYFDAMDPATKTAFQQAIDQDMLSPNSIVYGPSGIQAVKWQWGAEGRACNAHSTFPMDFSSLHTNLGGWWKLPPEGGTAEEVVAFVTISKDAAAYDPSLYSANPSPDSLIIRTKPFNGTTPYQMTVPGLPAINVFRLNGELLEESNGALLVRWRDIWSQDGGTFDFYQRGAFALGNAGLMIRWGDPAVTAGQAQLPVLGVADTCDSAGIDCYDHNPTGVY